MKYSKLIICAIPLLASTFVQADDLKLNAEQAARELTNPNTTLATMNIKMQYANESGGSTSSTWFQPSMPMPLANGDKVFFRPAIGYVQNHGSSARNAGDGGFTDLSFDLSYAPTMKEPSNLVAFGVFATLPTGSKGISAEQYALGPELLLGKLDSRRFIGALSSHQWGIDANSNYSEVNRTNSQLFWIEIGNNGWTYGSDPQISYDWNTHQFEVPLNMMVSKTILLGERPWKLGFEVNYYIEKADFRPDFMLQFSVSPVVENKLANFLK
ncbi:hypothetical protein [Vibrio rotiferianus]|uniref:hypothetical protein n=1 Tax=Vibrio rotiferianus TaxID=190895 RepID=UPI0028953A93|nr:putative neuromedin U [Vibrio rotiferianus]